LADLEHTHNGTQSLLQVAWYGKEASKESTCGKFDLCKLKNYEQLKDYGCNFSIFLRDANGLNQSARHTPVAGEVSFGGRGLIKA
jgi:hypothetical protein